MYIRIETELRKIAVRNGGTLGRGAGLGPPGGSATAVVQLHHTQPGRERDMGLQSRESGLTDRFHSSHVGGKSAGGYAEALTGGGVGAVEGVGVVVGLDLKGSGGIQEVNGSASSQGLQFVGLAGKVGSDHGSDGGGGMTGAVHRQHHQHTPRDAGGQWPSGLLSPHGSGQHNYQL